MPEAGWKSDVLAAIEQIHSNLAYIKRELPDLDMPEDFRAESLETCASLQEDTDKLRAEVEHLQDDPLPGSAAIESLHETTRGHCTSLDQWVTAARSLADVEPKCVVVRILIEESGANMLRAYLRIWDRLGLLGPKA